MSGEAYWQQELEQNEAYTIFNRMSPRGPPLVFEAICFSNPCGFRSSKERTVYCGTYHTNQTTTVPGFLGLRVLDSPCTVRELRSDGGCSRNVRGELKLDYILGAGK